MKNQPFHSPFSFLTRLAIVALFLSPIAEPATFAQDQGTHQKTKKSEQPPLPNADDVNDKVEAVSTDQPTSPRTVQEARTRARILHEAFSGALQVMHRDFFREEEKLELPSRSLEDVFSEMSKSHNIKLSWLAVNAKPMTMAHKPSNEFEKAVVKALSGDANEFEKIEANTFKYAGSIRLSASCVKCHVLNRTSNQERKAALVITMPLQQKN